MSAGAAAGIPADGARARNMEMASEAAEACLGPGPAAGGDSAFAKAMELAEAVAGLGDLDDIMFARPSGDCIDMYCSFGKGRVAKASSWLPADGGEGIMLTLFLDGSPVYMDEMRIGEMKEMFEKYL